MAVAQENPTFQPAMREISSITQSSPAEITTTFDHDYRTGDIVRIYIPDGYGMKQIDGFKGDITVTGTDTFTMDINSTSFDALVIPIPSARPWYFNSVPHIVPVGEVTANLGAAVQNIK